MYEKVAESPEEIAEIRANYAALVAFCDETFGRLLDHFDRHDLWRDTCLVLTTDHGFLLSEHDWWGKNRMPYYEEISRIPLMIWHPDFAGEAGTRRGALTQTADLMPTFLEMAGIPVPAEVTARSLLPVMADGAPIRDGVILGMFGGPICAADGVHTYFRYPKDLSGRGFHEYTLMPAHMAAHFATEEFEGMELASPFDFTKGAPVMRIQAREWAARPPFQDELGFDDVGTRLYRLPDDPRQERPVSDAALEARMLRIIERELRRHDAPPETYANYGLEAPEEVRRLKGQRPSLRDGGEALAAPREEVTEEEPTGGTT
jgi:hypothetical protein